MNLLCDNYTKAQQNRLRVQRGYCNRFYEYQLRLLKRWKEGTNPPKGLITAGIEPVFSLDKIFSIVGKIKVEDEANDENDQVQSSY
jgi:hypothetical protein